MYSISFVKSSETAQSPKIGYPGDAGFDLFVSERVCIPAHGFADVPSGISCSFPDGLWGRICGRSSTIRKRGLLVVEGIIDNGYTGLLYAGVWNLTDSDVMVEVGERLAQMIPFELVPCEWVETTELPVKTRGTSGFGSSGT